MSEGRAELALSEASSAKGDAVAAIVHARAAAAAYVPGASHQGIAFRRLRAIAEESEAKGDTESALFAWRSIRAVSIGSRSLFTPGTREREAADAAIVRLSSALSAGTTSIHKGGVGTTPRMYSETLSAEPPPRLAWSALLLAGVALWLAGGVWLTARGWDADGRIRGGVLKRALALAFAGALIWVTALLLA